MRFGPFGGAPGDGGRGPGGPGRPGRPGRPGGAGGSGGAGRSSGAGGSGGSGGSGGARPGRPGALLLTVIAVAALAGLFVLFSRIYTDVLWFDQLGYSEVFWTSRLTQAALFVVAGTVMGLSVWLSLRVAWRRRERVAPPGARDSLGQMQQRLESLRRLLFLGIPLALGLFAGAAATNAWQTVLLFLNQVPYGQTDPQFGLDIMFYLATLPFLRFLLGFLTSVVLVSGIAGLAVHYLYGGVAVREDGRPHVGRGAGKHVAVTVALFLLLQALTFWLNRYRTAQSQTGAWAGALYTDVNAVIPTSAILAVTALLVAGLFVWAAFTGRWRLPLVGAAVLVITSLVAGSAYPYLVQQYQVRPSERSLEAEFIARNIAMTREAYGLDDVQVTNYEGSTEAQAGALEGEAANTANIRLMDPNLISQTFGQLQQFRPYYWFPETLHVDRYELDGSTRDTILAVRDVNVDDSQSWVNRHTIYTHGYGVVAADASEVAAGGRPQFLVSEIPTRGPLANDGDYEPRIYFGQNSPEYSVVGAPEGAPAVERDRPQTADSAEDTAYTFQGDGGPSVGSLFRRLVYAVKFGSPELVLSSDVNEQSQILYDREPAERVRRAAPYLTVDSGAYPAIVDGRVQWIVDAYTTSDQFPYSTVQQLGEATQDALNRTPDQVINGRVNYIRNSVKATVDAYDGSVRLYAWDDQDPLLQAWQKVYPTSLTPYSEMSADLMDHVRYPEDMFKVQRELLGRYHVTDAGDFYENNDAWSVPEDPTRPGSVKQPPYYMTMQMPGQDEPAFSLTSTYIPQITEGAQQRNVLYGFLAADGDAGTGEPGVKAEGYGTLRLLELPRQTTVPGPGQAQANFDSNDTVSRELNLLRQGASDVLNGNMITLPVAGGILYVQPVYVRSSGGTTYPTLRKVLVSFGDQVGFADTLQEALDQVFGGDSGAQTPQEGQVETPAQPGGAQDAGPQQRLRTALIDAQDAINRGQEALANGDWAAYGEQQRRLEDALQRATEADDELQGGAPADPAQGDAAQGQDEAQPQG
ncbi:UPF0182 family protein [Micrococcus sp.]|uniref:UPF0182 family membrane protein n=1 Tax=Micrococcus sp. TaxID=1271 RepID=UPI0039C72AC1